MARYVTWIDGEEATVEILERAGGRIRARIEVEGAEPREVSFDHAPDGEDFHVILDDGSGVAGRVAKDARHRGHVDVRLAGHGVTHVRAMAERDAWLGAAAAEDHDGDVSVSMPGLVVKVLVELGQPVEADTPVLIIEAMKMENEVKAGRAGAVAAIHVAAGDAVEADAVLMEIGDAD